MKRGDIGMGNQNAHQNPSKKGGGGRSEERDDVGDARGRNPAISLNAEKGGRGRLKRGASCRERRFLSTSQGTKI